MIAHELAHVRRPVARTRFLLDVPDAAADAEERAAQAIGSRASRGADFTAGIVGELPVAGARTLATQSVPAGQSGQSGQVGQYTSAGGQYTATGDEVETTNQPLADTAQRYVHNGQSTVDSVTAQATGGTTGGQVLDAAAGLAKTAGAALPHGQELDRLAEALEERLLRQIERRGGRYAGVF